MKRRRSRNGQVLVIAILAIMVILGFCALAIDMMFVYLCQSELQNAVDSASLAGATQLVDFVDLDDDVVIANARAEARSFALLNRVAMAPLQLADEDIRFGRFDPDTRAFVPREDLEVGQVVDSIWVRGRRTEGSLDGPVGLFFAPICGVNQAQIQTSAIATQPRRYIMFVMDRSGSMCYDTAGVQRKYTSAWWGSKFYAKDVGGRAYGPSYSNRLEHFQKDVPWDVPSYAGWVWMPKYMLVRETREIYRQGRSNIHLDGWWLHVAYFHAKRNGQPYWDFVPQHIQNRMQHEEPRVLDFWIDYYDRQRWRWQDYAGWDVWGSGRHNFRYAHRDNTGAIQSGWMRIPSDVDLYGGYDSESDDRRGHYFWADSYGPVHGRCGYAVATQPLQPLTDSQDAAVEFIGLLDHEKDRCGLVTYARRGSLDHILTADWATLTSAVQSYDSREATNTAEGIKLALDELIDSGRADGFGQKVIICLTDGNANTVTRSNGGTDYYQDKWYFDVNFNGKVVRCRIHPTVAAELQAQANRAAANGVRIYTVSFGNNADIYLAPEIAEMTEGAFYYAEESEDLGEVFRDIFRRLPAILNM